MKRGPWDDWLDKRYEQRAKYNVLPRGGRCYAVEYEDGAVKVGSSKNVPKRLEQLQKLYRRNYSEIVRVYIGDWRDNITDAEGIIHNKIRCHVAAPCEKKEIYQISFDEAVRTIREVVPDEEPIICNGREDVLEQFPNLEDPYAKMDRLVDEFVQMVRAACH